MSSDFAESDEAESSPGSRYWVRAVDRTMQLLEAVAEDGGHGKTLGEVARRVGMPAPSALRYLATLTEGGFVEHEHSGEQTRYRLGLGVFKLAERAAGNRDFRVLALPHMQQLVERYQETVNLAAFRQNQLVIIEVLEGLRSIRQGARVGEVDQLRSTALGKAVLATHSDDEAMALLRAETIKQKTTMTIMDDDRMLRELRTIRARGYAVDNEESEIGLRCVGVAIVVGPGQVYGLSISGPSHLFSRAIVRDAGPTLCTVARQLNRQLTLRRTL
jgi:IclR family transcriptional regulator, acetate operon repressor